MRLNSKSAIADEAFEGIDRAIRNTEKNLSNARELFESYLKDYNEKQHDQRVLDDDRLSDLIEVISRHRLGLKNANADREIGDILADLAAVRQARERADKDLDEVLVKLNLGY